MKKILKKTIIPLIILTIAGGGIYWYVKYKSPSKISFVTTELKHGDLLVTINATGTVEPEEVIDVGAQVAGKITEFGKDAGGKTVDYGSFVKKGTVLAWIDDSLYAAEEAQAQAQVELSRAGLIRAQADLQQAEAKLRQTELDWQRASRLGPLKAISQSAFEAAKATYEIDVASQAVCFASIKQAEATLAHSQAALRRAKRNLEYCTITAPVDGVIIDRRVNIGQTVVASLNAPSLFLIAKDLRQMQVWVAVNEADIGKIYAGQPVTFTVDAYPGETFVGKVGKIRLNASMTQNVVTYTVEILTDNANGRLLPYLTANVKFELSNQTDVVCVSNTALRWNPTEQMIEPAMLKTLKANLSVEKNTKKGSKKENITNDNLNQGTLWVLNGKYVRPIFVTTGQSDGNVTQVSGNELPLGVPVVSGIRSNGGSKSSGSNPFMPKLPSGGRGGRPPH